jgi:glycosyltransferase involved in cell wall biosynthesis
MKYKICIVTTVSVSIDTWVKPFLQTYRDNDFDVTVACNMSNEYKDRFKKEYPYVSAVNITMPRGTSFLSSIKSIFRLYKFFRREKFDLVQFSTPNASFYSAVASFFARIPIRLYCQWGMVFVGMKGFKRLIFKYIERITCRLSTEVQPDSNGNLEFCRQEKFYSEEKSRVIWNGSAKGIDLERYDISKKSIYREEIRNRYGIPRESIVLGFVGRLGREKGCNELFSAYKALANKYENFRLLFVGSMEKEETIEPELLKWFYESNRIIKTGHVPDVEKHMAAMDIFILPSYREGFGMSVVEAEAMGVPVIVTNIPGPVNGMIEGETGLTVPVKNAAKIIEAVEQMIGDRDMMSRFGNNGAIFAKEKFNRKILIKKVVENRIWLLEERIRRGIGS